MSMIRALVFDCFGVLQLGNRDYLFDKTPVAQHDALRDLNVASDYGFVGYNEYLQQVSEMTGWSPKEIEATFQSAHSRNGALVAEIQKLRATYKIGLLSNVGQRGMEQFFSVAEREELFDAVVLSSDVAAVKPHPEMYEVIAHKLDVAADECIMIDDVADNVAGAIAVGMRGIQFRSTTQVLNDIQAVIREEG